MITLISAAYQHIGDMIPHEDISDILLDSIVQKMSLVDEIIFVYQGEHKHKSNKNIGNKTVKYLYTVDHGFLRNHSISLYLGTREAKNEYIIYADIDSFYIEDCSVIFTDLMDQYDLNFIGAQHYDIPSPLYGLFPTVMNMLTKKSFLPSFQSEEYPFPDDGYDLGTTLYNWSEENQFRWLSFKAIFQQVYNTKFNDSNFGEVEIEDRDILFHRTSQDPSLNIYKEYREQYYGRSIR